MRSQLRSWFTALVCTISYTIHCILLLLQVLKGGMPTRVTYAELKDVLKSHAAEADRLFAGEPETALISAILWAFEVPSEAFRLGKTRVFFRAGQISTLEKILR
jgi:myosin heavy subunit